MYAMQLCRWPESYDDPEFSEPLRERISILNDGRVLVFGRSYGRVLDCDDASVWPRRVRQGLQDR